MKTTNLPALSRLVVSICLALAAMKLPDPLLANQRVWGSALVLAGAVALMLWEVASRRKRQPGAAHATAHATIRALCLFFACGALGLSLAYHGRLWWLERSILRAEPALSRALGAHLIVGYRDLSKVKTLAGNGLIAGVFVTGRNIQDKTVEQVKQELDELQQIRRNNGLPPLWVATDQEGGIVSRMSPPLPQQPPLSQLVGSARSEADLKAAVQNYAAIQGRGLASMGFNLNFAPVLDLNYQVINPSDRFSKIYQRAIASDPKVVSLVAETYCRGIQQAGVRCTLKHFPGLGRIFEDTHQDKAALTTPVSLLEQTDWAPFRDLLGKTNAFTMLGHVKLPEIDPLHPVSFSQPVVGQILRGRWGHQGVLITDDFSMGAVYNSDERIDKAAVAALNAGVDLILISFDPDLYYGVMDALLVAARENKLNWVLVDQSSARLAANRDF